MSTAEVIRSFIMRSAPELTPENLSLDTALLEDRVLDSLNLLKLIVFLENRFGIHVSEDEIDYENFASIGTIVELVKRKAADHGC